MNLRHGQLWQRLGLTVLSGILVVSFAPATAAAPTGGQEISDDAGSFNGDVARVGTGDVVPDVARGGGATYRMGRCLRCRLCQRDRGLA